MNCENCTLCCTLLPIKELHKDVNEDCKHCTKISCGIYENRPQSCKDFECYWTSNDDLPDYLRPDRCHVIFEKIPNVEAYLALVDPLYPNAYLYLGTFIDALLEQGFSVVVSSYSNQKKYIKTPPGVSVGEVMTKIMKEI